MSTLLRILIFIIRLTGVWIQSVNQHFVAWTKPDTSSLLLGTLTDLARSKSELAAENAFLVMATWYIRSQNYCYHLPLCHLLMCFTSSIFQKPFFAAPCGILW